jgi:hypothetical protein
LHPFDLKTVLFAKHAQHVVLIHFPIALFIIGVLFDFLAQCKKQRVFGGDRPLQLASGGDGHPRGHHRTFRAAVGARGAENSEAFC